MCFFCRDMSLETIEETRKDFDKKISNLLEIYNNIDEGKKEAVTESHYGTIYLYRGNKEYLFFYEADYNKKKVRIDKLGYEE